jgi:hypothetical protein
MPNRAFASGKSLKVSSRRKIALLVRSVSTARACSLSTSARVKKTEKLIRRSFITFAPFQLKAPITACFAVGRQPQKGALS